MCRCSWTDRCVRFFFKQKAAYESRISDWSSDVCSSDLSGTGCRAERSRRYRCRTAGVTSAAASASRAAIMTISNRFDDVQAEWELLDDWEDRYRLLIDLGRAQIGRASCRERVCKYG